MRHTAYIVYDEIPVIEHMKFKLLGEHPPIELAQVGSRTQIDEDIENAVQLLNYTGRGPQDIRIGHTTLERVISIIKIYKEQDRSNAICIDYEKE